MKEFPPHPRSPFAVQREPQCGDHDSTCPPHPCTKYILALAYFPMSDPDVARHRLTRWINGDRQLLTALLATGYQPRQHHFTARQTALIYEYLGEP